MKLLKRISPIVVCLLLCFSLFGCWQSSSTENLYEKIETLESRIAELEEYESMYNDAKDRANYSELRVSELRTELEEAELRVRLIEDELRWYEDNCFCSSFAYCDFCDWPAPDFTLKLIDGDYYCAECLWDAIYD